MNLYERAAAEVVELLAQGDKDRTSWRENPNVDDAISLVVKKHLGKLPYIEELFKRMCSLAHIPEAIGRELLTGEAEAYRQRRGIKPQQSNSSVGSDTAHAT